MNARALSVAALPVAMDLGVHSSLLGVTHARHASGSGRVAAERADARQSIPLASLALGLGLAPLALQLGGNPIVLDVPGAERVTLDGGLLVAAADAPPGLVMLDAASDLIDRMVLPMVGASAHAGLRWHGALDARASVRPLVVHAQSSRVVLGQVRGAETLGPELTHLCLGSAADAKAFGAALLAELLTYGHRSPPPRTHPRARQPASAPWRPCAPAPRAPRSIARRPAPSLVSYDPLRRSDQLRLTPAETKILDAMIAVEDLPPDTRLTRAGSLLAEARGLVADFVDGVAPREGRCLARAIVNGTDQGRCALPDNVPHTDHVPHRLGG